MEDSGQVLLWNKIKNFKFEVTRINVKRVEKIN